MGVDTVVLRFASIYGPGKTARHGKMGVTSQIVEAPARGEPFHIAQGGEEKDDFIYNKDSALGIYLATIADNPKSRVYNIGTGVGLTLNDFARVLRRHLPNAVIEIGPGLNFLGMPYPASGVYDISRARTELGYAPEYDLEQGIADYLASLRQMKIEKGRRCATCSSCPNSRSPSATAAGRRCAKRCAGKGLTPSCCGAGRPCGISARPTRATSARSAATRSSTSSSSRSRASRPASSTCRPSSRAGAARSAG